MPINPVETDYSVKYYVTFHDHFGANWRIDIYGDVPTQQITPTWPMRLVAGETPLIIKRSMDDSDNILSPVQKSSVEIHCVIDYGYIEVFKKDFFVNNYEKKVIILKDNQVFWQGWLIADFFQYVIKDDKFQFSIKSVDGLSILDVPVESIIENINGYYPITSIFQYLPKLLNSATGYEVNLLLICSIVYRIQGGGGSIDNSIFNDSYFRMSYFYNPDDNTFDGKKLLKELGAIFGCRFFVEGDKIWMVRISDMAKSSWDYTQWNNLINGPVARQNGTIDNPVMSDYHIVNDFALSTLKPSIKEVNNDIDLKYTNRLKNAYFRDTPTFVGIPNWTEHDNKDYVSRLGTGTADDPYYLRLQDPGGAQVAAISQWDILIETGQDIVLEVKVDMTNCNEMAWGLQAKSNDSNINNQMYYKDGAWHNGLESGNNSNHIKKEDQNENIFTISQTIKFPPTDVNVPRGSDKAYMRSLFLIRIYCITGTLDVYSVKLSSKWNGSDKLNIKSENEDNLHKKIDADTPTLIDDVDYYLNSLVFLSNPDGENNKWVSNDVPDGDKRLDVLNSKSAITLQSYIKNNVQCNILSNEIMPHHTIKILDDIYIQMSDEYNVRSAIHKFELLQVKDIKYDNSKFETSYKYNPDAYSPKRYISE